MLLLLVAKLVRDDTLRILYTTLPLISVASLIIVWFLRSMEVGGGDSVNFIPLGFSTAICGCLHISSLGAEARGGLPPRFVFGLFMAAAAGVFLAWFGIWSILGPEGASAADLVVKVVYLVAVGVQLVVLTQRQPILASKAADIVLSEVCGDLTERFSLSSRESEILYYLIQGRSYAYIAERQFVSINTVKTHVKRIYAKTGAHSKQELLNLVHSDRG
jgi:DNA-binding CsgD family transcriptional regulator